MKIENDDEHRHAIEEYHRLNRDPISEEHADRLHDLLAAIQLYETKYTKPDSSPGKPFTQK